MKNYRFILEKKGSRHTCPGCGKRREFTRYEDTRTGELLPEQYGICNRLDRCGYHLNPYKDGYTKRVWEQEQEAQSDDWKFQPSGMFRPKPKPPGSFVSKEVLQGSLHGYEQNYFVQYLVKLFGESISTGLIGKYFIGSSNYKFRKTDFPGYESEGGAVVFWQIDISGRVRSGKVMLYDPEKGKRVKEPFNHVTWVHSVLKLAGFELRQCLYGEHLLRGNEFSPVAIVESEKTAIIASVYFPQFLWLACGAMNNLNAERCGILKGRHVILFPDLNAFNKWNEKAKELSRQLPGTIFSVSDLLEKNANGDDRAGGMDIADFLTRFNWKAFRDSEKCEKDEAVKTTFFSQINAGDSIKPGAMIPEIIKENNWDGSGPGEFAGELNLLDILSGSEKREKHEAPKTTLFGAKMLETPENLLVKVSHWEKEISELEAFFNTASIPAGPIQFKQYGIISDTGKFIYSHLSTLKANNGNRVFIPFLTRLMAFQTFISNNTEYE